MKRNDRERGLNRHNGMQPFPALAELIGPRRLRRDFPHAIGVRTLRMGFDSRP